jgi:hypothetical protein
MATMAEKTGIVPAKQAKEREKGNCSLKFSDISRV